MDGAAPNYALALHLKLGTVGVSEREPVVLGRSSPCLVDDPCVSRQHCVFAFDARSGAATVTWMARRPGRLRRRAAAMAGAGAAVVEKVACGMQRQLFHGDILTLLADSGRHPLLVSIGAIDRGGAPLRPGKRGWALIEADSLADARAAARYELQGQTRANQALIDSQKAQHETQQQQAQQRGQQAPMPHAQTPRHDEAPQSSPQQAPQAPSPAAAPSNPTVHDLIRASRRAPAPAEAAPAEAGRLPPPPDLAAARSPSRCVAAAAASAAASAHATGEAAAAGATFAPVALQEQASHEDVPRGGVSAGVRLPWRRAGRAEHHAMEIVLVATVPSADAADAVGIGFRIGDGNVVTGVDPYTDAHAAGLLVGDIVRTVNGHALPPREPLHDFLRRDFALAGDTLRFGVTRRLDEHVDHTLTMAIDGERRRRLDRQPNSPRMRPRDKFAYEERWEAYRNHPDARPRRDPHSDKPTLLTQWANGGTAGRML